MAQVRGTFGELYDNVDKTFYGIMKDQLKELARIYTEYYNVKTSDRKFERVVTYVPSGLDWVSPNGTYVTTRSNLRSDVLTL